MGRPTTKRELQAAAREQFEKMWQLFEALPPEEQNITFDFGSDFVGKEAHWARDKNLRDVLIHLYEWHQLVLNFARANRQGDARPFLSPPYNWSNYAQMNVEFWKKHQDTPYDTAVALLKGSHNEVMDLIDSFSDEELFTKKYFSWTGTSSLGSYFVSSTASHYQWAIKKYKKHLKK